MTSRECVTSCELILYCFVFSRTTWLPKCIEITSSECHYQQGFAFNPASKILHNFTGCQILKNSSAPSFLIQPGGLSQGQSKTKTLGTQVFKGLSSMIGASRWLLMTSRECVTSHDDEKNCSYQKNLRYSCQRQLLSDKPKWNRQTMIYQSADVTSSKNASE
jgi:hypothetical protein